MSYFKSSILVLLIICFISSCSKDDNINSIDNNFLSANINGISYNMDSKSSVFTVKRIIGASGIIKLDVQVLSEAGNMRFIVPSYSGKSIYLMGKGTVLPNTFEFENTSTFSKWVCRNPGTSINERNFIEVINDDGKMLEGNFSFIAQNPEDQSLLKITEGKFRLVEE